MAQERRDVMLRRISILGGDLRQRWLAEELRQCGFEVAVYQVPELENTFSSLQQTVKSAQALALPMPALTKDGWIRADPQPLPLIPVLESLRPGPDACDAGWLLFLHVQDAVPSCVLRLL